MNTCLIITDMGRWTHRDIKRVVSLNSLRMANYIWQRFIVFVLDTITTACIYVLKIFLKFWSERLRIVRTYYLSRDSMQCDVCTGSNLHYKWTLLQIMSRGYCFLINHRTVFDLTKYNAYYIKSLDCDVMMCSSLQKKIHLSF